MKKNAAFQFRKTSLSLLPFQFYSYVSSFFLLHIIDLYSVANAVIVTLIKFHQFLQFLQLIEITVEKDKYK